MLVMRLLMLLVGGSLGCSLSSEREELKNSQVAARGVGFDRGIVGSLLASSAWSPTGALNTARYHHTATLLTSGKVLVAGGTNSSGASDSAEVYDPATKTWSSTGPLIAFRYYHTATLLLSGKVLVAGGTRSNGAPVITELYDPATGTWTSTGPLPAGRYYHTATLLPSGKVLVAGGIRSDGNLTSAEVYDPATETWTSTGSLATGRYLHTATLLPSGKVLVVGGYGPSGYLASAEVYDPATGTWSATNALAASRSAHTATLLPSGKVLVAGGYGSSGHLTGAEVYDPASETWSATGALVTSRDSHTATLLPSGKVLVAGGSGSNGAFLFSAEVYDPDAGTWSSTGSLTRSRFSHTATLLPTGQVLVAGGTTFTGAEEVFLEIPPPAAPVLVAPAHGSVVSTGTPEYSGTAEAGSTVTLIVDGLTVDSIPAQANGTWSFTPTSPLADGTHTLRATATNGSGTSPDSNTHIFTVDTRTTMTILTPVTGSVRTNPVVTYAGITEPGAMVTLVVDGQPVGTLAPDSAGYWEVTPSATLAEGLHSVVATAIDGAGNFAGDTETFTVDTRTVVDILVPGNGTLLSNPVVTYLGTVEPGATVTVEVDGQPVGTTTPTMNGTWSVHVTTPLGDGAHTVTATALDVQGHTATDTHAFTVDATSPAAPVLLTPVDGSATTDRTLTYTGTAEAGSTVFLTVDDVEVGTTTADAAGTWSFTPVAPLADGLHSVKARARDGAGNTGPASPTHSFTVDTTPPAPPVVLTPADGATTSDTTPGFSGTAEAFSVVVLFVDGARVGTPAADAAGAWSFTSAFVLGAGPHTVYAHAVDAVGNTSPDSRALTFTVDTSLIQGGWRSTNALSIARGNHTATALRSGEVLVTGGEGSRGPLASSELYDPVTGRWRLTSALHTARTDHTATVLLSGKVLVTGGRSSGGALASAEVYDPDTETWLPAGALTEARTGHTTTLLPSGKVLVTGGENASGALASAELYDPATGTWSTVAPLKTPRTGHTTTLLPSGEVLVIGGESSSGYLSSAELYDPATDAWRTTSPLNTARAHHAVVRLPSGQVLVIGGEDASGLLTSAEVYEPSTGTWSPTCSLATARARLTAVPLPSGRVMVTGSVGPGGGLASTEVYTPSTGIWSPTGLLETARHGHTATVMNGGQVLITGGWGGREDLLASAEVYGALGAARPVAPLEEARTDSMAVVLPDGQVLVAGGSGTSGPLKSAQLFNPTTEQWTDTPPLGTARASATATLLLTGEVLVAGGTGMSSGPGLRAKSTGGTVLRSAELFDPVRLAWRSTGELLEARHSHAALLLSSGQVLVTGGLGEKGTPLSSTELYDPATQAWSTAGSMHTPRQRHMVAQLPTGQVLVAGGLDAQGNPLSSAEVFDPEKRAWTEIRPMSTARASSTAAVLHTSQVLVAGGTDGTQALQSAEIYDPLTKEWIGVGALHTARKAHAAQLLPTGRVLLVGGSSDSQSLDDVEVYDPRERKWEEMTRVITPREDSMTVLLPSGQVLVIAGRNTDGALASTEVYDEYGAPDSLRPVVTPVDAQRPGATLVLRGNGLMAPRGGSQRVRLQTVPEGALKDADATGFSDTSVRVTLPEAPDGVHLLFVLVNDIAGGQVVHVDGTPPAAPGVSGFVNTPRPTLSGTAEPRATVYVILDDQEVGTVKAQATGAWSLVLGEVPLGDGTHTATATAMDAAHNESPRATELIFIVDTQAPEAPGVDAPGRFIKEPQPALSGTAEAGSTVTVYVDEQRAGTAPVDSAGLWSVATSLKLRDGLHTATATATDPAGNTGPASARVSFTVDTQPPAAPEVLSPREGETMDAPTASANGTAEPDSTVTVSVDGEVQGTARADSTGAWQVQLRVGLTKGEHTLTATAADAADNVSPATLRAFAVDGDTAGGCSGCAAGSGEPSLMLLGLAVLGRRISRRRSHPA